MSTSVTLDFCINHSFLLDSKKSKIFETNFVKKISLIKPQLELFLEYYKSYTENGASDFKKSCYNMYTKDFVIKLSQFLNLSCDVSFTLLCNYLNVDEHGNTDSLESKLTRGYDNISLMQAVYKYYHNERLSLIRIIRYIFCDRKDSWRVISNIITNVSSNNGELFLKKVIWSYESSLEEISVFKSSNDFSEDKFALFYLEEQVILLETLFLITYSMKDNNESQTFKEILRVFQKKNALTSMNTPKSCTSKATIKSFLERIGFLKGLILIQTSRLDKLVDSSYNLQSHFLTEGDNLSMLSIISSKLTSQQSNGPCLLLASLVCTTFHSPDLPNNTMTLKLAEDAIVRLDLFKYISTAIKSSLYSITSTNCSYLELIVHSALFDLVSLWCQNVHLHSLSQSIRQDLTNVMCDLVNPLTLYTDLKLLKTGFSKMLEDVSLYFPVNLDMLKVISSLMNKPDVKEGTDNIIKVLSAYLDNLSWFCDERSAEGNYTLDRFEDDDNGKRARSCRLIAPYTPYDTVNNAQIILDKGLEGFVFDDVVVWAVRYSAWDVVMLELELGYTSIINGNNTWSCFQRLETILEFLSTCFKNDIKREMIIFIVCKFLTLIDNGALLVDGCDGVLEKIIYIAGYVLSVSSDHDIIKTIVSTKNLFPNSYSSSEIYISGDCIVSRAWQDLSIPSHVSIVQAYLYFSLQLIHSEKFMFGDFGVIPSSIIFGSILFITSNLLVSPSHLNLPHISDLVLSGLTFLNDIITLEPSLYITLSEIRKSRLELIQNATLDTISQSEPTLQTVLAISSINVDCLIKQTNVSSQMFLLKGNDEKLSTIVRMALTIIKSILSHGEFNNVILKILNSTINEHSTVNRMKRSHPVTYTHQYVLSLLEFLGYPYGVKIARMALMVLKQLVVKTNVSIVACLGEKSSRIKDILLTFVCSKDKDQVIRGFIFEFWAECVLVGRHGILQLIFENDKSNTKENIVYQSCLEVIENFQPEDSVSMVLLVSVTKFLSAIWISDCQTGFMPQKCSMLWSSFLNPLKFCLDVIKSHNPLDIFLYDFIGNAFGLFAMEIYSSRVVNPNDEIVKSLNIVITQGMMVSFLDVFNNTYMLKEKLNLKIYFEKILTSTTLWKTLIFTTLSMDSKSGIISSSVLEQCQLLQQVIISITNLILLNESLNFDIIVNITDILVSCMLNIINKKIKLFSSEQAGDILNQIYVFMKSVLSTNSFQSQLYHTDLLTCCSLLLQQHSVNTEVLEKYSHLTEGFITMLTAKSSISKIDSKVLVHAFTAHMSINTGLLGSYYGMNNVLENGTLVNSISMLEDMVKSGDLSVLTHSLLTFLLRVCSSEHGANRALQSSLVYVMEMDLCPCDNNDDIVSYLSLTTNLMTTLVQQCGKSAYAISFRFISAHWERLQSLIINACERMTSRMTSANEYNSLTKSLTLAESLFDLLWHLSSVKNTWTMFWPCSMVSSIMSMVTSSLIILISVLNEPQNTFITDAAFILRTCSRSLKNTSPFPAISPRKKSASVTFDYDNTRITNVALESASACLEGALYRLLHSSIKLYSRSTYIISEEHIYKGFDYSSKLLSCNFGEPTFNKFDDHLSFGSLFSLLSSTQSLLRDNLPPLNINNEKIVIDGELIRQMHEVILGTIVSHSVIYLTKFDQSQKTQRNNFILDLKSELSCYLDGLSKSRRRNMLSSSSPISYIGPRVTSTPCVVRSHSIGESLEGFCLTIDCFKKSLDL